MVAKDQVKLVIFDTLSYHFRHPGMDMSARRRMMDLQVFSLTSDSCKKAADGSRVKERIGRMTTVNRCAVSPVSARNSIFTSS